MSSLILNSIVLRVETFGRFLFYLREILVLMFRRPFRVQLLLQHMEFIGNKSVGIILLTGFFTGAVFGLQTGGVFSIFRAESMMGGATGLALAMELAPLMSGFLLAGRAGSAMAAEIATMVVGEQIDAMESMGVDPISYLVVPRVIASMLVMPVLCALFMLVGMLGTYIVGMTLFYVDPGIFFEKLLFLVKTKDVITGIRKTFFFAFFISTICCHQGLHSQGGARGVGDSTTNAVVKSLLTILVCDFVISYIEVRWLR